MHWKQERRKLRAEWVERQKQRIAELEQKFAEMQKRFEENVARVVDAVKERELRRATRKNRPAQNAGCARRGQGRAEPPPWCRRFRNRKKIWA